MIFISSFWLTYFGDRPIYFQWLSARLSSVIKDYPIQIRLDPFGPRSDMDCFTTTLGFILSGFLVGLGSKLMNGCTSGHGLCGLPRLSLRSVTSVLIFLSVGIGLGWAIVQNKGLDPFGSWFRIKNPILQEIADVGPLNQWLSRLSLPFLEITKGFLYGSLGVFLVCVGISNKRKEAIFSFFVGILFGLGLLISGMTKRINILTFLQIGSNWNPTLLFVLGAGVLINLINFQMCLLRDKTSYFGYKFSNPQGSVDAKLILGALFFGIGWSIGGLCPGPWFMLLPLFNLKITLLWGIFMLFGTKLASFLTSCSSPTSYTSVTNKQKLT